MKFNIIEQESKDLSEIYPRFKEEYLNPDNSVSDIKKILNLTNSDYRHLREELKEETGIQVKPNHFNPTGYYDNPNSYITQRSGRYEIRKGRKYYGRFLTLEDARKQRDKLKAVDWDKDKL